MKTIAYAVLGFTLISPVLASACFEDWGVGGYGMMGYGGEISFFMVAGGLVWIIVGILAGIWLWQNISKK